MAETGDPTFWDKVFNTLNEIKDKFLPSKIVRITIAVETTDGEEHKVVLEPDVAAEPDPGDEPEEQPKP